MSNNFGQLGSSRIDRRKLLAIIGSTTAGAALIAACGGDDDDGETGGSTGGTGSTGSSSTGSSPTATTGSSGATGASSSGGEAVVDRLVYAHTFSGTESNDTRDLVGGDSWQLRPIYESLLTHDRETGEIMPSLATEWTPSEDGTSISFKLRKGIPFHDDWGEVTVEDVVFSYELSVADPLRGDEVRGFIESVEAVGDDEIIIHLTQPDSGALVWIATDQYIWSRVVSKKQFDEVGDLSGINKPPLVGTGPWKYVEREPGSFIRFERVEDHWRKTPDFKELEIRLINENSTRLASLLADEVHMTTLPVDLQSEAIGRGMEFTTATVPSSRVWMDFLGGGERIVQTGELRFPDSPFNDDRIRKALNKAIDRDALNEAFLEGRGEVMIVGSHHATRAGWDESWVERFDEEYGYDPDAAKALLEEAGFNSSNPLQTNMFLSYYAGPAPFGGDMQETIIGYWDAIGVQTELITMDRATLDPRRDAYEFSNHLFFIWTASDLNVALRVWFLNNLRSTVADYTGLSRGWTTPELDQLFDDMLSQLDADKYAELSQMIGEELFINHGTVPLFWLPTDILYNPDVVAGWTMPGMYGGFLSHLEYVEAVKA